MLAPLAHLALLVQAAPDDEDVVAGWTGFAVFVFLIIAVALLGWSLTKQLRKADKAAEQGLYDPSQRDERRAAEEADRAARRESEDGPQEPGA